MDESEAAGSDEIHALRKKPLAEVLVKPITRS